jgi:hypothetical protein
VFFSWPAVVAGGRSPARRLSLSPAGGSVVGVGKPLVSLDLSAMEVVDQVKPWPTAPCISSQFFLPLPKLQIKVIPSFANGDEAIHGLSGHLVLGKARALSSSGGGSESTPTMTPDQVVRPRRWRPLGGGGPRRRAPSAAVKLQEDSMAFSIFVLGSFLQMYYPYPQFPWHVGVLL